MSAGTFGATFTIVVFASIGWGIARLFSQKTGARALVIVSALLVVAAIAASFIEDGIWLVGVDEIGGRLDLATMASCLGACAGLLTRVRDRRRVAKA